MPKVAKWIGNAVEEIMKEKFPVMKVVNKVCLCKNIVKVRFHGNITNMDFQPGYAVAIRVNDTEFRNYTPYFFDKEKGILEIIFHMHGSASGTDFIRSLAIGQVLKISIPRGKKMYESSAVKYIVFGDETGLSLAWRLQVTATKEQQSIQFYFELNKENFSVIERLGIKNYSVMENKRYFNDEKWVKDLLHKSSINLRAPDNCFVLTGNAKSIQTIRRVLKKEGVKGRILAQAYWAEGKKGL